MKIVEAGAHDGRLAGDIVRWLRERQPGLYGGFEYVIVEPSARRRERQRERLRDFEDKIRWIGQLGELAEEGIQGIVFSNELLDAMPVHRLGWDAANRTWFEWGVAARDGRLIWARMEGPKSEVQGPKSGSRVAEEAARVPYPELPPALLNVLPDGFTTEVCPAATGWWTEAAGILRRGKLLTIDYGLTAEQFFSPERKGGTLRAHSHHHPNQDLLAKVGEQDLTAHVNFTVLQSAGEAAGLNTEALMSQAKFLTQIAGRIWKDPVGFVEWTAEHTRQFQTLTHPEHLGRSFRVLIQSRTADQVPSHLLPS